MRRTRVKSWLAALSALVMCAASGCADEVDVELDFGASQDLFLRTDTVVITVHRPSAGEDGRVACGRLQREATSAGGFTMPTAVENRYGPMGACETLRGATLEGLPREASHYVATATDSSGMFIAYGCNANRAFDVLPANAQGVRRLLITMVATDYYATLTGMPPPFTSIETRCGIAASP
jgi:hypothetical protein